MEQPLLPDKEVLVKKRESYFKRRKKYILGTIGILCLTILFLYLYQFTNLIVRLPESLSSTSQPGDWAMFRHDLTHSGSTSRIGNVPQGNLKWSFRTDKAIHSSPTVSNGKVYVGSQDGHLYALDAETGDLLWKFQTESWVESSPAIVNGVVYFGSNDGNMYAVDADTGTKLWSFDAKYVIRSSPAIVNGKVYFGCDAYYIYALSAETGEKLWSFKTDNLITSSPAISEGILLIGCSDGFVYALNAHSGRLRLKYNANSGVSCSPVIQDGIGYVVSGEGTIFAIDIKERNWILENELIDYWRAAYIYGIAPPPPLPSGYIWTYRTMQRARSSPAVVGNIMYTGIGHSLVAFDLETKLQQWRFETGDWVSSSAAIASGVIYVGSEDGMFYALDINTGKELWSYDTGMMITSSPAIDNGVVFVGSHNGTLYAFE
jgi:outer membrane protein assembly factor BamB